MKSNLKLRFCLGRVIYRINSQECTAEAKVMHIFKAFAVSAVFSFKSYIDLCFYGQCMRVYFPAHFSFWIFEFYFIYLFFYSRFLLVINFIHISVYMSIPIAQFITPPPPPRRCFPPLGVHTFVLYICVSISALHTGSSVPFF